MTSSITDNKEVRDAFAEYDREETISNFKVACALGILLMPAGIFLDRWVYAGKTDLLDYFLKIRFLCSGLIGLFFGILLTKFGRKHHRKLGVTLFALPASAIAVMIYYQDGAGSLYYAGLNLVLLVLAFVLHWTFFESLSAVALVIIFYVSACLFHGPITRDVIGEFVNNLYFLILTGIIVVTGSYFHSKSRYREFALRFELNKNRRTLENSNKKLDVQNKELADTIQKLTEAESQLVQSEKMASLGRMSAGIIHEINNPLNFATTGLFTLKKKGKHLPPEQQEEYVDIVKDIEDGIGRVKNIVSDLRMFTHPSTENLDQVEVSEAITSALRFLSNEIKDKVVIEQKLVDHQTVRANKNKLIHVFVNLIQNSLDALRTKPFNNCEKPTITIQGRVERGSSYIVVHDNGPGIAREHVDKIFDPFFTTKNVGEGMGLGLSICYRIVEESRGKITVRTEQGKYCEFTLELPAN